MIMGSMNGSILSDAMSYTRPADISAKLTELREHRPICLIEPKDIRPYWAITRYEDIRYIESNPELFSAEPRAVLILEALEKLNQERFGENLGSHGW
jgi:hypothetical protein